MAGTPKPTRRHAPLTKGRPSPEVVRKTLARLEKIHPDAHCELVHANPFQLIVATVLSAQTTDVAVNKVTPALFARYPDARAAGQGRPDARRRAAPQHARDVPAEVEERRRAGEEARGGARQRGAEDARRAGGARGSGAEDGKRRAGSRLRDARGDRRRYARAADRAAARLDEEHRAGEDRERSVRALPALEVGHHEPRAHLPRPAHLLRAEAELRRVRSERHLPERLRGRRDRPEAAAGASEVVAAVRTKSDSVTPAAGSPASGTLLG